MDASKNNTVLYTISTVWWLYWSEVNIYCNPARADRQTCIGGNYYYSSTAKFANTKVPFFWSCVVVVARKTSIKSYVIQLFWGIHTGIYSVVIADRWESKLCDGMTIGESCSCCGQNSLTGAPLNFVFRNFTAQYVAAAVPVHPVPRVSGGPPGASFHTAHNGVLHPVSQPVLDSQI